VSSASISRRSLLGAAACAAAAGAFAQNAQPLRIFVPVNPGSTSDILARLLADALSRSLGQPVIVDNRPGAAGSIAVQALLAAPRDGQNWLFAVNGMFSEVPHSIKLPFDPLKDVKPLVEIGGNGLVLVGAPTLPARDFAQLMAWAKTNRGKLSFASYSPGTVSHVLGLMLSKAGDLEMVHVPYKSSPPALQDVMAGLVNLMFDAPPTSLPLIEAGKLRAYAVTSAQRLAQLPHVPTMAELGHADMTRSAWVGLWTTPDVPAAAQQRMRAAVLQAIETPAVHQRLSQLAIESKSGTPATPEELARRLEAEHAAMGATLRSIGHKPE